MEYKCLHTLNLLAWKLKKENTFIIPTPIQIAGSTRHNASNVIDKVSWQSNDMTSCIDGRKRTCLTSIQTQWIDQKRSYTTTILKHKTFLFNFKCLFYSMNFSYETVVVGRNKELNQVLYEYMMHQFLMQKWNHFECNEGGRTGNCALVQIKKNNKKNDEK